MDLSTDFIAVAGFVILFALMLLRVPVGMNVFVIKSVVKDVSFTTIFKEIGRAHV